MCTSSPEHDAQPIPSQISVWVCHTPHKEHQTFGDPDSPHIQRSAGNLSITRPQHAANWSEFTYVLLSEVSP